MPKLWERKGEATGDQSSWFVRIPNHSPGRPPSYTFQLQDTGIRILRGMGLCDEDEFSMDEFRTLQDLGLTYTLNEGSDGSVDIEDISDDVVADIPPQQRVRFVEELLDSFTVDEVASDGFYRLLASIDDGPDAPREQLRDYLLEPTPTHSGHVMSLGAPSYKSFFDSDLLAALVCYVFAEFTASLENEVEGYVTPIASNDDWVYLITEEFVWDLGGGLCEFWLDAPDFYLERYFSAEPEGFWFHEILEEIHTAQFVGDMLEFSGTISAMMVDGLDAIESVVIVPRHAVGDFDLEPYLVIENNC